MPVVQACPVTVTGAIRRVLARRSRGQKTPYRDKVRAQIVLLAAGRRSNTAIAVQVGISVDTVRTWRGRFAEQGLAGLADRPAQAGPRGSPRCRSPRSKRWPASYRPMRERRCRDGRVRNWPARS